MRHCRLFSGHCKMSFDANMRTLNAAITAPPGGSSCWENVTSFLFSDSFTFT